MFDVITDHQVIAFGVDAMGLYATGQLDAPIVTAKRTNGTWTIHADGIDDTTAQCDTSDRPRKPVLTAMTNHALAKLGPSGEGGRGYSTTIPHGLRDQP